MGDCWGAKVTEPTGEPTEPAELALSNDTRRQYDCLKVSRTNGYNSSNCQTLF